MVSCCRIRVKRRFCVRITASPAVVCLVCSEACLRFSSSTELEIREVTPRLVQVVQVLVMSVRTTYGGVEPLELLQFLEMLGFSVDSGVNMSLAHVES
jgi:hypothetical protein